ncbi:hypothetical protein PILCRDRAFT_605533 [Piloderma croceum F 1598]|uniref:Uncharacterized protein n=1 Tax=Piloderma croceum (strain F 1598) TaxID=765440 RepID=A0A0C3FDN7_PILCF|nr:hypothetical protein PILCRDRAFT_605533 [Piloderma croceum F 1598]
MQALTYLMQSIINQSYALGCQPRTGTSVHIYFAILAQCRKPLRPSTPYQTISHLLSSNPDTIVLVWCRSLSHHYLCANTLARAENTLNIFPTMSDSIRKSARRWYPTTKKRRHSSAMIFVDVGSLV